MTCTWPVLPLRGVVAFPGTPLSLILGRPGSVAAVVDANSSANREIFLVAQRLEENAHPVASDLYRFGTIARIEQFQILPDDGQVKILVEGNRRARITRFVPNERYFEVEAESPLSPASEVELLRTVKATFEQYARLNRGVPPEMVPAVLALEDPDRVADRLVEPLQLQLDERQALLETIDVTARLERVHAAMLAELQLLQARPADR